MVAATDKHCRLPNAWNWRDTVETDFRDTRREYVADTLRRSDLTEQPLALFLRWMNDAVKANVADATAMTLATADATGRPSARIVLLKLADERGFSWFTDMRSEKGQQRAENNQAELLFYWRELSRQIRVNGRVERLSEAVGEEYFASRPEGSRFSAAASLQGSVIENRDVLENRAGELREQFPDGDVPRPEAWGGYCLIPDHFEFWQGRESRLHDRFVYRSVDGDWVTERLSP